MLLRILTLALAGGALLLSRPALAQEGAAAEADTGALAVLPSPTPDPVKEAAAHAAGPGTPEWVDFHSSDEPLKVLGLEPGASLGEIMTSQKMMKRKPFPPHLRAKVQQAVRDAMAHARAVDDSGNAGLQGNRGEL